MQGFDRIAKLLGLSAPATDDGRARKSFILHILLVGVIALIFVGLLVHVVVMAVRPLDSLTYTNNSLPLLVLFVLFAIFSGLHVLSLRGYSLPVSYTFVAILFLFASYMSVEWGVDVTAGILFYILGIIAAGILIHTRFGLIVLLVTALTMSVLGQLQSSGLLVPDRYWRSQTWSQSDTLMTVLILAIISVICALATWQAEYALARVTASEHMLKKERDELEAIVERRTNELRIAQMERLANIYRFAEFGRLSSGLFHNLANLLTATTLSMDRLQESSTLAIASDKHNLARAVSANIKMKQFIESVRLQLAGERRMIAFSPSQEIQDVVPIILHRAHECGVDLSVDVTREEAQLFGDPAIFNQIVINLLSNAIDAYIDISPANDRKRVVAISLQKNDQHFLLSVKDWGCGIADEFREKIFEPFFTTKPTQRGIGLGLALVKRMVECDFRGRLSLQSQQGEYSEFTVIFPFG